MKEYKGLGDFLVNGTEEDKADVFNKVIDKSIERQNLVWHLYRAKVVLEEWYDQTESFNALAERLMRLIGGCKQAGYAKRMGLRCKTLGLVFHDRYKLLLENK